MDRRTLKMTLWLCLLACLTMFGMDATRALAEDLKPKYGGILKFGVDVESVDLDPHITRAGSSSLVTVNICENLVTHGPGFETIPVLAKSWEVSEDGKTYLFHLREGVKFHNGREFTAEDVKWNFDRIMSEKIVAFQGDRMRNMVKAVNVENKYAVKIELLSPAPSFISTLTHFTMAIIPSEEVEAQGGTMTKPVGTGPFVFKERIRGRHVILEKFKDYWDPGLPYLDGVTIITMPEEVSRVIALKTGEVDFIASFPPKDVPKEKEQGEIKIYSYPSVVYQVTNMNTERPPLNDVRVRRAIRYAIDPQKILDMCAWGQGSPTMTAMHPSDPYNQFPLWVYNPEIAKILLKEAGYENGFDLNYRVGSQYARHVCAVEVIQSELKKVGIRVKLELMEWGDFQTKVARKMDYDLSTTAYGYFGDPDDLSSVYGKNGVYNKTHYSNPEVNALLELGRGLNSFEKRYPIYHQISRIVNYECPMIVQLFTNRIEASAQYVHGYPLQPEGRPGWRQVWMDK